MLSGCEKVLLVAVNLLDVIMFERWNRAIGIPDWIFMLGKSAAQNTIAQASKPPLSYCLCCPDHIQVLALLFVKPSFPLINDV